MQAIETQFYCLLYDKNSVFIGWYFAMMDFLFAEIEWNSSSVIRIEREKNASQWKIELQYQIKLNYIHDMRIRFIGIITPV